MLSRRWTCKSIGLTWPNITEGNAANTNLVFWTGNRWWKLLNAAVFVRAISYRPPAQPPDDATIAVGAERAVPVPLEFAAVTDDRMVEPTSAVARV
jgi:hypothetical protein